MSAFSSRGERPSTHNLGIALDRSDASELSESANTKGATHRCRIYRIESKAIAEGRSVFTVVWDTVERPLKSESLPTGEIYFATSGSSYDSVVKEAQAFCKRLDRSIISDWSAAGSI